MTAFDRIMVVDWSANNAPKTGKDSIWIADLECASGKLVLHNPATRFSAMHMIEEVVRHVSKLGRRLLVGFDFAFGYPAGSTFLPGKGGWEAVWQWLGKRVEDTAHNQSNRFEVAADLNNRCKGAGPFWGHPAQHANRYGGLGPTKPNYTDIQVAEKRAIDQLIPSAQPVWKLAYTGSVGSQALLGISHLQKMRESELGHNIAIWPFETKFADDLTKPVIFAELYPSLYEVNQSCDEVKDAAQVRSVATALNAYQARGCLIDLLDGPRNLGDAVRQNAMQFEAWMVGIRDERVVL